ncbi:MAG TPA: hypothetical protein VD862_01775 [Candidatus Paceibacterota bacterium]|nr:hypothetical protein [Candidatus Paceibacterota bacterium]
MKRAELAERFRETAEKAANDHSENDEERTIYALLAIALAIRGLWPDISEDKEPSR